MTGIYPPFFLFGMGRRDKFIYQNGQLTAYPSMQTVFRRTVLREEIIPGEYTVRLVTPQGESVIREDEQGVRWEENGHTVRLTEGPLCLPSFAQYRYREALRILHHEICINIVDGRPVPNLFVYDKPWYRDSAMMLMALEATGNAQLLSGWIRSLTDCYDRNNAGNEESDNLGQVLYLLGRTGNREHPLIPAAIAEAKRLVRDGVLTGTTDFAPHPVYQTKWLKLGLEAVGADASWLKLPETPDSYSGLFWMDGHTGTDGEYAYDAHYPYLSWARLHTAGAPLTGVYLEAAAHPQYPVTSETNASQARYEKLRPLFPQAADDRCAAPHSWHAAEMFLYLLEFKKEH